MAKTTRSGENYSLPVRILLWGYYTILLLVVTAAMPCILVHALLFDDDRTS